MLPSFMCGNACLFHNNIVQNPKMFKSPRKVGIGSGKLFVPNEVEHGEDVRSERAFDLLRFQIFDVLNSMLLASIVNENVDTAILVHDFFDNLHIPCLKIRNDVSQNWVVKATRV